MIEGNAQVKVPPYPDIESLAGAAGSLPHPLSWPEMREIAHEDHIKEKFGKERCGSNPILSSLI